MRRHRAGARALELLSQQRSPRADDIVTPNSLATHLGMTRQNVARLTAEAVIEPRSDGCYDQTACRLRYIKHLRDEHRRSPRTEADAKHTAIKTEMLQLRLMEKKRELVKQEDVSALIDQMCGITLTHLSGMSARCSSDIDAAGQSFQLDHLRISFEMSKAAFLER